MGEAYKKIHLFICQKPQKCRVIAILLLFQLILYHSYLLTSCQLEIRREIAASTRVTSVADIGRLTVHPFVRTIPQQPHFIEGISISTLDVVLKNFISPLAV